MCTKTLYPSLDHTHSITDWDRVRGKCMMHIFVRAHAHHSYMNIAICLNESTNWFRPESQIEVKQKTEKERIKESKKGEKRRMWKRKSFLFH